MTKETRIIRARTNNLKGISCSIPQGKLTVITGISGSGKSSLAFDTLYAEGQRRYVESLSTYARQFIERMKRPEVDFIHNIQPAIALEQKNRVKNARSTVGTATEINDYLRLLFARIGKIMCPACKVAVQKHSPASVAKEIQNLPHGQQLCITGPITISKDVSLDSLKRELMRAGFSRCLIKNQPKEVQELTLNDLRSQQELMVIIDRLELKPGIQSRLIDSLEMAFRVGKGTVVISSSKGEQWRFSSGLVCDSCGRQFKEPEPHIFSFYSPLGACPTCQGFGKVITIDMEKVIPNPQLSLNEAAIALWNTPVFSEMYDYMRSSTRRYKIPWDVPFARLSKTHKSIIINGRGDFCGIKGFFEWLETKKYKIHIRIMLSKFRGFKICPDCNGARLVPEALNVYLNGYNIAQLQAKSIKELRPLFDNLSLSSEDLARAQRLLAEIKSRLKYLQEVGLDYLTLNRQTRTLSGGEAQRINLATALGSALIDTLYVLDEPTVGLHTRDSQRLLKILKELRTKGNTVVVVEHDLDIIRGADKLIDLGPQAGEQGGSVVYEGDVPGIKTAERSITGKYLNHRARKQLPQFLRQSRGFLTIKGAKENNLKNIEVKIPLGVLACVTGVSGSGKSTLIQDTLYAGYRRIKDNTPVEVGRHRALLNIEQVDDMVLVDQKPIGRSIRSNPVTYVKAWDEIRKLLAETREARSAGLTPRNFSFNISGGRCEECQGAGIIVVDMQFLADVQVVCDHCDGKRFKKEILEISYRDKNVDDILSMTVMEAMAFFADKPKIVKALQPLLEVGLGYIRLGQNTSTLSGGEAQRLKLASFLAGTESRKNLLLLFDEPTTGLHPADIDNLVRVLNKLLDQGYSIVVIEHNLDLISCADYIIDLGPEGGDEGGYVVVAGTPLDVMSCPESYTGKYLKTRFRFPKTKPSK